MTYGLDEFGKAKTCRVLFGLLVGLGFLTYTVTGVCAASGPGPGGRGFGGGNQKPPPGLAKRKLFLPSGPVKTKPFLPSGPAKTKPVLPSGPVKPKTGPRKGVLSKQNQGKMQKAFNRLGKRLRNARLRSALQNLALGRSLSAAQVGCLGAYLNDPGCGLTADERACIQQDLGLDAGGTPPDDGGVLLLAVERRAAADRAGLRAGDVIVSFGGVRTRTFEELRDAVRQADGPVQVAFINGDNGETEYCTIAPQEGRIGATCE